jgi:hypothetical protein
MDEISPDDLTKLSHHELDAMLHQTEQELHDICLLKKSEPGDALLVSEEEFYELRHRMDPVEARLLWRLVEVEGLLETRP